MDTCLFYIDGYRIVRFAASKMVFREQGTRRGSVVSCSGGTLCPKASGKGGYSDIPKV